MWSEQLLAELEDGRTDLILPLLESGLPSSYRNQHGVSLMQTCALSRDDRADWPHNVSQRRAEYT